MVKIFDRFCDGFICSLSAIIAITLFYLINPKGLFDTIVSYQMLIIGFYISGLMIERKCKGKK